MPIFITVVKTKFVDKYLRTYVLRELTIFLKLFQLALDTRKIFTPVHVFVLVYCEIRLALILLFGNSMK